MIKHDEDPKHTLKVLEKARESLTDPKHWSKGTWYGSKLVTVSESRQEVVETYCALGAVNIAYGEKGSAYCDSAAAMELARTINAGRRNSQISGADVVKYNDVGGTHRKILSLFDRTILRLRQALGVTSTATSIRVDTRRAMLPKPSEKQAIAVGVHSK